jgi:AcrR family transcriptional regulator
MTLGAAKDDLSRRQRRKLEVRERILVAAVDLFDELGVQSATVSEICERADVADKTFFNHFQSKQGLMRELAQHLVGELVSNIEAARRDGATTAERLRHFFASSVEHAEEAGPMHRELLTELVHAVHDSPAKSDHARRIHEAFAGIVGDGLRSGDVTTRHDPETLTQMILGAYYVLMFDFANIDGFPIRRQAMAVSAFLADALAP